MPAERLGRLRQDCVAVIYAFSILLSDIYALQRIALHCCIRLLFYLSRNVHVGR